MRMSLRRRSSRLNRSMERLPMRRSSEAPTYRGGVQVWTSAWSAFLKVSRASANASR